MSRSELQSQVNSDVINNTGIRFSVWVFSATYYKILWNKFGIWLIIANNTVIQDKAITHIKQTVYNDLYTHAS